MKIFNFITNLLFSIIKKFNTVLKKISFVLCFGIWFLTISVSNAQSGWEWQNPLPNGNDLFSTFFTDTITGYIVGSKGTILKTIDGGINWNEQISGTTELLTSVFFINNDIGFAVGYNGTILKTTNAGLSWSLKTTGIWYTLESIYFVNSNTGYIVSDYGKIYKTTDTGNTWVAQTSGTSKGLNAVFFTNENIGYAVGNLGIIIKTIDGGSNWTIQTNGTGEALWSVYFVNDTIGFVSGSNGTIRKTTNAGVSWITKNTGIYNYIYDIHFVSIDTGYATCGYGKILKTTNGGTNWTVQQSENSYDLWGVFFTNNNIGYIVGYSGTIFKTTNGGNTWERKTKGITNPLSEVYFINDSIGFVVGSAGTILKTINGGLDWVSLSSGMTDAYLSVFFTDVNTGYITLDYGKILKTINGGIDWTLFESGIFQALYSTFFTNTETGYVVGYYGTILKTANAGNTWIQQTSGTTNSLNSVYFINDSIGYAVGEVGTIIKTENGGTDWTVQTSGTTVNLKSLYFTDTDTGYVVGGSGKIFKTTNGGITWFSQVSTTTKNLSIVYFTSTNIGYVYGIDGMFLKTTNGGMNWLQINSGTRGNLYSGCFIDEHRAYIIGDNGTILKTYTNGEYFNPEIDSLHILSFTNITSNSNCSLPYHSNLSLNTFISGLTNNVGDYLNYHIWFGDGSDTLFTKRIEHIASYITFKINHTYQYPGAYTLKCKVLAPNGKTDSLIVNDLIIISDTCGNITGTVYKDLNGNCNKDSSEFFVANRKISLFHGSQLVAFTYTDNYGFYSFDMPNSTDYNIIIDTTLLEGYSVLCPAGANYFVNTFPANNLNFSLNCGQGYDLEASLTGSNFRPGINGNLQLKIKNNSCNPVSGNFSIKLDPLTSFINSYPAPDYINGDSLTWNYTNITNQQDINIPISLHTSSGAWISDTVCFTVSVAPFVGDNDTTNNVLQFCFPIVNSWDPNEKNVNPSGNIQNDTTLTYTIHFQNTGTAEALNIFIIDSISNNLDLSTFNILSSSHIMTIDVINESSNTILKFNFNDINLPDSTTNNLQSMGYVNYSINTKSDLLHGTKIKNTAYIYFDFNPAIITNTIENVVNYGLNASTDSLTICSGDSILWNGIYYKSGGTHFDSLFTQLGSDSICSLILKENPTYNISTNVQICSGDNYELPDGTFANSTGIYISNLLTASGCDSIFHTNLIVTNQIIDSISFIICEGDSIFAEGAWQYNTGIFHDTTTAVFGCDSIIITYLTVNSIYSETNSAVICNGDSLIFGTQTLKTAGVYYETFTSVNGCDSVVSLTLTLIQPSSSTNTITTCDSYIWIDGITYTSSNNTATFTLTNASGCDSIITLDLTINSNTGIDVATACDSYMWIDGNTYTSSNNTATFTLTNASGCDSVVTLDLTINNNTGIDVATACDSYTWIDGITYTSSNNTATFTLTNASGCDSVITLDLTINSNIGIDDVATCDSYIWIDGNTYTSSNNTATFTLTNATGCDSVVTLELTINNSTSSTTPQTTCEPFIWTDGNTYTSSGTYTQTLVNSAGCDSVATLELTIKTSSSSTTTASACDSYLWADGNTYTSSGTYADTLVNAVGCDSVATLNLTIKTSSSSTTTASACDSYLWTNGNTYTSSGTYNQTLINSVGCDSVVTLNLSINPAINVDLGSDDTLCSNLSEVAVLNAGNDGMNYLWNDFSTVQTLTVNSSSMSSGEYEYSVIVTDGVCASTDTIVITVDVCSGISMLSEKLNISMHPNPTTGKFYISIKGLQNEGNLSIIDVSGRTIFKETISEKTTQKQVDFSKLPKGIYAVKVVSRDVVKISRIVVQ
ncbi:MAG: hypothetical protein A2046_13440 [Bacteroidetes bacterium GWA2_30_7]|nr:MAG: hypothetical protein A2046_13440 [Bacteroidetes bacterium GWA2_30_7]